MSDWAKPPQFAKRGVYAGRENATTERDYTLLAVEVTRSRAQSVIEKAWDARATNHFQAELQLIAEACDLSCWLDEFGIIVDPEIIVQAAKQMAREAQAPEAIRLRPSKRRRARGQL